MEGVVTEEIFVHADEAIDSKSFYNHVALQWQVKKFYYFNWWISYIVSLS